MGEWRECSLSEFVAVKGGYAFKSKDFVSNGVPVIKIKNVKHGKIDLNDADYIPTEIASEAENFVAQNEDVLISMTGSGVQAPDSIVGRVALVDRKSEGSLINQRVGKIVPLDHNKVNVKFVYYFLSQKLVQWELVGIATGSANQVNISGSQIGSLRLRIPDYQTQKKIASILSSLDDKIELNRKMNETLEEMARAIFKSWFVDFDPVHAKARGEKPAGMPDEIADLFPSEFVHSDQLNKPIPKGWDVKPISNLAELNAKSWTKKNAPESVKYIDLANTKDGEIHSVADYLFSEAPSRARRILSVGDTIIGTVRPGNRSLAYIANDGYTGSTGFAVLTPKEASFREFVYIALTQSATIDYFAHLADGAAYPAIRPEVVANYELVVPDEEVIKAFSELTFDVFSKIFMQKEQNFSLSQLRDSLLPKLISGEIEV